MKTDVYLSVLNTELKEMVAQAEYSKKNRKSKCIIFPFKIDNINLQIGLTAFCNTKTGMCGSLSHYIQYKRYKVYPSTKLKTVFDLKKAIIKARYDAHVSVTSV